LSPIDGQSRHGSCDCLSGLAAQHKARVFRANRSREGDALEGHGIALLPTFIAGAALRSGALVPVLRNYRAPDIALYAIYPPTRHLSSKVRLFIDFLVQRFGERDWAAEWGG
jgi:DNA-binding transcriptional LysR family regulator